MMGFLERYRHTSCSVMVCGDSVLCFFGRGPVGAEEEEASPPSATNRSLFFPACWDFLLGEDFFRGESFLEARGI